MNNNNHRNRKSVNESNESRAHSGIPEIGQMVVTRPMFGRLDVYLKKDGKPGAKMLCEEDGGRYGVAVGVRRLFSEIGTYAGWGYVNTKRQLVFRFVIGEVMAKPGNLLAIDLYGECIGIHRSNVVGSVIRHGAWVAFYAHHEGKGKHARLRRKDDMIIPLDGEHLLVTARLITGGRLRFPEHGDILNTFFDAISNQTFDPSEIEPLVLALTHLANNSSMPAQVQALARVEKLRLNSSGIEKVTMRGINNRSTTTHSEEEIRKSEPQRPHGIFDDVVRVELQLD